MNLFPKDKVVGIFLGFSKGGMEFHADLTLPYDPKFMHIPMHGQFLIVQLESEDEGVLGRITSISSHGRLSSGAGEDFGIRAVKEDRPVPEDLREQYLKYRIDMRVLGVIRTVNGKVIFAPSHRRLPHVGSKVAFLSDDLLKEVTGHNLPGADIGFLALGEFVYCKGDSRLKLEDWIKVQSPAIIPKFDASHMVSRRTFVFARAGFGKSNLVKLLFANLYKETPTIDKRGGGKMPVGTIIFDPEGEYFWPDVKNRPGLCDVPELEDKIVIFTRKQGPSKFYSSFIGGTVKLDIRRLRPGDVIGIALSPDKQDQQNVRKLKGMSPTNWSRLVDAIYQDGNNTDVNTIRALLSLEQGQDAELYAARANMTTIVNMLHDPSSQMMDALMKALKNGKLCIVDVSQVRGSQALILSGLILQKIFEHNQDQFTMARPETIPTIAVVEEAQSVLGSSGGGGEGPYVTWVKEGRKYDLGALLITQQPGSISHEILSQGDNWYIFHLLSAGDLMAVKKANAHFSDDILSALLNEPIPGNGVFWSSASGKSYPIPIRVLSFEETFTSLDPEYNKPAGDTFALKLKEGFDRDLQASNSVVVETEPTREILEEKDFGYGSKPRDADGDEPQDVLKTYLTAATETLKKNKELIEEISTNGVEWWEAQVALMDVLPDSITDKKQVAYDHLGEVLDQIIGPDQWETERRPRKRKEGMTTWIFKKDL